MPVPWYMFPEQPPLGDYGGGGAGGGAYNVYENPAYTAAVLGAAGTYTGPDVTAPAQAAPPPPTTPAPAAEVPFVPVGIGQGPVPPDVSAALGEPAVPWAGLGGITVNLFKLAARRRVPRASTVITRELVRMASRVPGALYRLLTTSPLSPSRALVPLAEAASPVVGIGVRAFGLIGGVLYPTALGVSTLGPKDIRALSGYIELKQHVPGAPRTLFEELGLPRNVPGIRPLITPSSAPPPDLTPPTNLVPPGVGRYSPWRSEFERRLRERVQRSKRALEQRLTVPQNPEAGPPSPRPFVPPESNPIDLSRAVGQLGQKPPPAPKRPPAFQIHPGLVLGSLAGGWAIQQLLYGGGSTVAAPPAIVAPSPVQSPVPVANLGLTAFNAGFVGSAGTTGCTCKPRGPRRKCLQRAPVRWSGGPRKGRAAGTRCIRYATRKS